MFTIVANPRAWWPVSFLGVNEEGAIVENTFEMQFFILKIDDVVSFHAKRMAMSDEVQAKLEAEGSDVTPSRVAVEVVKLIAGNWRGVAVEGRGEVPWSEDTLQALLNMPNVLDAVMEAWHDCMGARQKIHQGN